MTAKRTVMATAARRENWIERAWCAEHQLDPTPPTSSNGRTAQRYAVEYCSACPVIQECARDALLFGDVCVVRAGVYLSGNGRSQNASARFKLRLAAGEVDDPRDPSAGENVERGKPRPRKARQETVEPTGLARAH